MERQTRNLNPMTIALVLCASVSLRAQSSSVDSVVQRIAGEYDASHLVVDVHYRTQPDFDGAWDFQLFLDSDNRAATGYAHGFDLVVRGLAPISKALFVHRTTGGGGPGGWGPAVGGGGARMVDSSHLRITLAYADSLLAHGAVRFTFETYIGNVLVSSVQDKNAVAADGYIAHDCNGNGVPDDRDIAEGTSPDCSGNGVPDECEPDCDSDGVPDVCAILLDPESDCDGDGVPAACESFARAAGPRYIAIKPHEGPDPVALLIRGDGDDGTVECVDVYVQADGTLAPGAHFMTPAKWCKVIVTDERIIPGHAYLVFEDRGTPGEPQLSAGTGVTTWHRGDTNHDDAVDFADIARVVEGFLGAFAHDLSTWMVDFVGGGQSECRPDRVVSFGDVAESVNAFLNNEPTQTCPPPCP